MSNKRDIFRYFTDTDAGRQEIEKCKRQFTEYINSLGDLDLVLPDDSVCPWWDLVLEFGESWPEPLKHDTALRIGFNIIDACLTKDTRRLEWPADVLERNVYVEVRAIDCFHFETDGELDSYNSYYTLEGNNMKERLSTYLGCLREVALLMGQAQELVYKAENARKCEERND